MGFKFALLSSLLETMSLFLCRLRRHLRPTNTEDAQCANLDSLQRPEPLSAVQNASSGDHWGVHVWAPGERCPPREPAFASLAPPHVAAAPFSLSVALLT